MNKFEVISDLIEELANHKASIIQHVNDAWSKCDFALSEPKIIASFIMDANKGVDYLNKNLAVPINMSQSRFVLKFGGVFTHQRPYVSREKSNCSKHSGTNPTESCELSDLLCMAVFVNKNKEVIASQASFFQAKKTEAIDNETQRWLYDFDDQFEYKATTFWEETAPNKPGRMMPDWAEQRASAFQYLLLMNQSATARLSPWGVDHKHRFAFYLYRLMTFSAGKAYEYADCNAGGWSSIVDDMLKMGGLVMKGKPRNSPDLDELIDYFNDFRNIDTFSFEHDKPGVPILLAILQDTQNGA